MAAGDRLAVGSYLVNGVPDVMSALFTSVRGYSDETIGVIWSVDSTFVAEAQAVGIGHTVARDLQLYAETCAGDQNDSDTQKQRMIKVRNWVAERRKGES